jgi:ATP-dependent helicase IRC3
VPTGWNLELSLIILSITSWSPTLCEVDLGLICTRDYLEMSGQNWLARAIFTTVRIEADLSTVTHGKDGDFQPSALSKAVNTAANNDATFKAWQQRAAQRKSTLVFCVDIQHVHDLTATFRRHGVDARYVTGETAPKLRNDIVEAFKRREFSVLLNCSVFTEGTDIPNIDCILVVRPTRSRNLLIQMIGRGARLYEGKEDFHVIDMVSSLKTGIVTSPSLYGLDPDVLVENATEADIRAIKEHKAKAAEHLQMATDFTGTLTFTDYDSVEDLIEDTTYDRHIRQISPFAWVNVDEDRYVLAKMDGNYITICKEEDGNGYEVLYTTKIPTQFVKKSPLRTPRLIARGHTFEAAIAAADTQAGQVFPFAHISKTAGWRKGPASEKQIEFLNRSRGDDQQLEVGDVTRGQANDMITKLKVRQIFV